MTHSVAFATALAEQRAVTEKDLLVARAIGDESAVLDAVGRLADLDEIALRNAPGTVRELTASGG
jgi:hypothetical protein